MNVPKLAEELHAAYQRRTPVVVQLGEKLGMAMTATRAAHACAKLLDERKRAPRAIPQVQEAVR